MNNEISIRPYSNGDEYAHVDLMWNSSKHVRNIQYWKWINSDSWGYNPIIKYAIYKNKIIGSYVINPCNFSLNNKIIKTGFATQVLVHSDFRDLSIIKSLNDHIIKSCSDESIDFIFGFPNNSIWNVNLRLFDWNDAGKLKYLGVSIDKLRGIKSNKDAFFLKKYDLFKLDKFILKIENINKYVFSFKASVKWFKWRFFENPLQYYKVVCVERDGEIYGLMSLKNYNKNGNIVGHIVYIEIIPGKYKNDVLLSLIEKGFDYFKFIGVSEVTLWRTNNDWVTNSLKNIGFDFTDDYSNFGTRSVSMKNIKNIPNIDKWNILMSNSDAF